MLNMVLVPIYGLGIDVWPAQIKKMLNCEKIECYILTILCSKTFSL
jgi:hypothetical protein